VLFVSINRWSLSLSWSYGVGVSLLRDGHTPECYAIVVVDVVARWQADVHQVQTIAGIMGRIYGCCIYVLYIILCLNLSFNSSLGTVLGRERGPLMWIAEGVLRVLTYLYIALHKSNYIHVIYNVYYVCLCVYKDYYFSISWPVRESFFLSCRGDL